MTAEESICLTIYCGEDHVLISPGSSAGSLARLASQRAVVRLVDPLVERLVGLARESCELTLTLVLVHPVTPPPSADPAALWCLPPAARVTQTGTLGVWRVGS